MALNIFAARRSGKGTERPFAGMERKDWRWKEIVSFALHCQIKLWHTLFVLFLLTAISMDLPHELEPYEWACCFGISGSSAHREHKFPALMMVYFARKPSQLFLFTQKHISLTIVIEYSVTKYAQSKRGIEEKKLNWVQQSFQVFFICLFYSHHWVFKLFENQLSFAICDRALCSDDG